MYFKSRASTDESAFTAAGSSPGTPNPTSPEFDDMATLPFDRLEEPAPASSLPQLHIVWSPHVRTLVS